MGGTWSSIFCFFTCGWKYFFSFRSGGLTTQASIVSGGGGTGDDFISGDIMEDNRGELIR